MAKIKKFDKKSLNDFRTGFEKAVEAFAKTSGVAITLGAIRYNETSFNSKIEVVIADTASGMSAKEALGRKQLDLEGVFFGLTAKDYGRTFRNYDGELFRLTGVKSNRPKYPIIAESVRTGKAYKFNDSVIKKLTNVKK